MLLTHFFIFTFPKKKFQNDSKRLTVIKYFIFDWQIFYKHDIIALCWTVSDLWLAVRGWEWQRRPGEEWAVWSGASRSSSVADTCGPALWTPRWCPGLAASHGRCWPSSSRAHALPSAQGSVLIFIDTATEQFTTVRQDGGMNLNVYVLDVTFHFRH